MRIALALLLSAPAARAGEITQPVKLPDMPTIAAPAIPEAQASSLIGDLARTDLPAAAAMAKLDALTTLVVASPQAMAAPQLLQLSVLQAQLPARYQADAEASRVLSVKMDRLATALQGVARNASLLKEANVAGAEGAGTAPLSPAKKGAAAAARREPPSFAGLKNKISSSPLVSRFLTWWRGEPKAPMKLGVDRSAMDLSVRPADDLFRYVNGTWLKEFKMPADKARFGAFDKLRDESEEAVRKIVDEAPKGGQIANLYASYLDEKGIEAKGLAPIADLLGAVDHLRNKAELGAFFGRAQKEGFSVPVGFGVMPDKKNPKANITVVAQAGLGLPDRDYYFKDDEGSAKIRAKYVEYLTKIFALSGEAEPAAKAAKVFALEKLLAEKQWTRVQNRDAEKTYNKMKISELAALAPGFDWAGFLREVGVGPAEKDTIVYQPSYFAGFAEVAEAASLEDWKLYLKARTLGAYASLLPKAYDEAQFEFSGKVLSGTMEQEPRWKRGVQLVNGAVGELVGKEYVARHYPDASRVRMEKMISNLQAAYAERINGLDWMSPETKKKALEKLAKFTPKIGYPKKWKDYSSLTFAADDLVGNARRSNAFDHADMMAKLGKPVDRDEWHMNPQTVNAYYSPVMNEVVFPAAILQAPFFNPEADDAVNYGAIGAVIGHEMSHAFDDQGSKYDGDGVMRNWWTAADEAAFKDRAAKLVGQFDAYEPLPGLHVNGKLTLGENIGDLGGLTVAYRAYRMSLNGQEPPVIDGFTGDQRFFLGWAQVWRSMRREESLRQQVVVDPHSPEPYRVNGVARNMPEFYAAFGLKPEDALYLPPSERVGIW